MVSDPRFYQLHAPVILGELVGAVNAKLAHGSPDHQLEGVAALGSATRADITFARSSKVLKEISQLDAGLCFCSPDMVEPLKSLGVLAIAVCDCPVAAFNMAASLLVQPRQNNFHDEAISSDAILAEGVLIGPGACIGDGVQVGKNTIIGPGAVIGTGCIIGHHCHIGANAVIGFSIIGDRVDIRPGAVLGEAGLGIVMSEQGMLEVTHFGHVRIADDVRVGSITTIDRAVFGETFIGERTKIDNQVQVAHNVTIGSDCVLAAFAGVSGSTTLGKGIMMGGRATIIDHIRIGDEVRIGAGALVTKDIGAGEIWSGYPARPLRQFLREQVSLEKLAAAKGNKQNGK